LKEDHQERQKDSFSGRSLSMRPIHLDAAASSSGRIIRVAIGLLLWRWQGLKVADSQTISWNVGESQQKSRKIGKENNHIKSILGRGNPPMTKKEKKQ